MSGEGSVLLSKALGFLRGFGVYFVFKREGFELFLLLILSFEWVELDR